MELKEALQSLDPLNDNQWTGEGAPKVDTLKELTGNPTLTRKDVTEAAPAFTRENPILEIPEIQPEAISAAVEDEKVIKDGTNEGAIDNTLDSEVELELGDELDLGFTREEKLPALTDFVKEVVGVDEEGLREAEAYFAKEIDSLLEGIKLMEQRVKDLSHFKLVVTKRINVIAPAPTEQESRMAYIRNQNDLRADRVARRRSLGFLDIKELDPRSKLDQAMAARPKPDQKRPTRV